MVKKRTSKPPQKKKSSTGKSATSKPRRPVKSKSPAKRRKQSSRKPNRPQKRTFLKLGLMGLIWGLLLGIVMVGWFSYDLPSVSKLAEKSRQPNITILARDGQRLTTVGTYYGEPVKSNALPDHVVKAFLATEDRRFFDHFGIDVFGLARAFYRNLMAGRVVQGGSTITQQLAKNFLLTQGLYTYQDRSLRRKVQEVILSLWLEVTFTKHQILTIYLNRVYFGSGAFGLGAASKNYYDKSPKSLNVYESALLAGLLKAPSKYSPHSRLEASQKRTQIVLKAMLDAAFISDQTYQEMKIYKPQFKHRSTSGLFARYFIDWVIESVPEKIGQVDEDLVVTTTLDIELQRKAEKIVKETILEKGESLNAHQASLISMTPGGSVRAMVGGVNYGESQYNRATQAYRQTGSVFKLFVYLAALEKGFHPNRKISDRPITIGKWSPKNYGWKSRGDIHFQDGFAYSVNTVCVRLAKFAGLNRIQNLAYRLGLANQQPKDLTAALGTGDATLMEMTGAFAHIANDGFGLEPCGIVDIRTVSGYNLYHHETQSFDRIIDTGHVDNMKKILAAVMNYGTGRKVSLDGRTCYGKSGTTQNYHDAWFIGFDPYLVTGVWCGNDDNQTMKKVTGAKLPGKIWQKFMSN